MNIQQWLQKAAQELNGSMQEAQYIYQMRINNCVSIKQQTLDASQKIS